MAFKETFEQLMQIERLLRSSSKPLEKQLESNKEAEKNFRQKSKEERAQAEKLIEAMLEEYSDNTQAQQYLQQIIQDIKIELGVLPKNMPQLIDTPTNHAWEQYGKFYDHKRYQRLLPYCQLAYLSEQNGIPEEHALKLALIFDNTNDALSYVQKNLAQNNLAIHDACLFVLPDVNRCNFTQWKILIKKNINDATFRRLLASAPEIEENLKNNMLGRNQKPDRNKIIDKKAEIEKVNKRFKELKRKHGSLALNEEQEYQKLILQLSNLYVELFEVSAGISLKEADLKLLVACNEVYIQKTQAAYKLMLDNGLTKQDFAKFVKLQRQDDATNIPDIKLDGRDFNYPGFYLMKVPVLDEMHAARAACFGKLTRCCQSLSGEAGEPCVIHGLTSPYGGFYVLCEGDVNHPKIEDKVIGQAWAWRSKNEAIVLDSVEAADYKRPTVAVTKELFEQLGRMLVQAGRTQKVVCGAKSGISDRIGFESFTNQKEYFNDYSGYSDSDTQRVLYDGAYPYYWYGKDLAATQATEKIVEQIMQEDKPLIDSIYLYSLLNSAMLLSVKSSEDKFQNSQEISKGYMDSLIRKVSEIAKRYNRLDELDPILNDMSEYLSNKLSPEEIISRIDKKTLSHFILNHHGNLLTYALKEKHNDLVLKLIELGMTIPPTEIKHTLLMSAANGGLVAVVNKLIEQGIDIDEEDIFGRTALYYAIVSGNEECALKLIDAGANINKKTGVGHMCSEELALRLIRAGKGLDNIDETTYLMYAAMHGMTSVCKKMIELNVDVNTRDVDGSTALLCTIKHNNDSTALMLIKKQANIHFTDSSNQNALLIAIKNKHYNIALKLIEIGANPNCATNVLTPLVCAIKNKNSQIALKLIEEAKADVNLKGPHGEYALHHAIVKGLNEVAIKLIEAGAKLDEKTTFGGKYTPLTPYGGKYTPLMEAAARGNKEIVLKLMEAGANVNIQEDGKTALTIAQQKDPKLASAMEEKIQEIKEAHLDPTLEVIANPAPSLRKRRP